VYGEGAYNVIHGRPGHPIQNRVFLPTHQLQPPTILLIQSESSQKSTNQEGKISSALHDIQNCRIKSIRAAANIYAIPRCRTIKKSYNLGGFNEEDAGIHLKREFLYPHALNIRSTSGYSAISAFYIRLQSL
jgi:hypothetical protein